MDRMVIEDNIRTTIDEEFFDGGLFTTSDIAEITGFRSWDCSYALRTMVRNGELEVAEKIPLSDGFGPSCGYTNVYRLPVKTSQLADQVAEALGFKSKDLSDYSDQELINELKRRMGA